MCSFQTAVRTIAMFLIKVYYNKLVQSFEQPMYGKFLLSFIYIRLN